MRLATDRIDLFYQHCVDPDVPIDDVAGTVRDLITEGKVRHFGLSEQTRRRSGERTPCSPSPPCKASTRCGDASPRPRSCLCSPSCRSGSSPSAPLAKGFLTGSVTADTPLDVDDFRTIRPRFAPEAVSGHLGLVQAVQEIAAGHVSTENQVQGDRYPEQMQRLIDRWATDDRPITPERHELSIEAACVCGSDLHPYHSAPETPSGTTIGHELIGVVTEVAPP